MLLTGFEPFGGSAVNPSQEVVLAIEQNKATLHTHGIELHGCILPVEARRGPAMLLRAMDRIKPHAVMCLGESGRASAITLERVFINFADYRIADNAGTVLADRPILRNGPAAYFATLPIERLREAVSALDIPCETSLSAGAYLCNHVAYLMLHHLRQRRRKVAAGFVHLPRLPMQVRSRGGPSMELPTMKLAVEAMVLALKPERGRRTRTS